MVLKIEFSHQEFRELVLMIHVDVNVAHQSYGYVELYFQGRDMYEDALSLPCQ
jgi:hypothetical protein